MVGSDWPTARAERSPRPTLVRPVPFPQSPERGRVGRWSGYREPRRVRNLARVGPRHSPIDRARRNVDLPVPAACEPIPIELAPQCIDRSTSLLGGIPSPRTPVLVVAGTVLRAARAHAVVTLLLKLPMGIHVSRVVTVADTGKAASDMVSVGRPFSIRYITGLSQPDAGSVRRVSCGRVHSVTHM
jgi:hypothetical protein